MILLFTICLNVFNFIFRAFIIKVFWKWFVLTKFPTLPTLETLDAMGLVYFVSIFRSYSEATMSKIDKNESLSTEDKLCAKAFISTIALAFTFFGGWVVHSFI